MNTSTKQRLYLKLLALASFTSSFSLVRRISHSTVHYLSRCSMFYTSMLLQLQTSLITIPLNGWNSATDSAVVSVNKMSGYGRVLVVSVSGGDWRLSPPSQYSQQAEMLITTPVHEQCSLYAARGRAALSHSRALLLA
jgi:hypothetical protein